MNSPAATILVVDDEIQNCKLLELLLRPEGHLTRHATNGEEALASIAELAPDLILLDVMMPDMDGYQVARTLKADPATANIPIIMVTALDDASSRLAGLNAGAEDFLTKPVDRDELWLRVRNLLRLKALSDLLQDHSVLLEQQVQARTAELQLFRTAMDTTDDAITLVNRSTMSFIEVNETACNMLGYTREEFLHMDPARLAVTTHEQMQALFDDIIAGRDPKVLTESQLQRKDSSHLAVEVHRHAQRSGADWIIVSVARDITERKQAEARIVHLNRVLLMLSSVNALIVRVNNRDELFREACNIAVDAGGFRMAMLVIVDPVTMLPQSVTSAGKHDELLAAIKDVLSSSEGMQTTLVAQAIRDKKTVNLSDTQNDPRLLFGKQYAEAGVNSMTVIPLMVSGEAVGVLALYASEIEFFQQGEMKLLTELAGDIAYAIDHIEKQERLNYLAYYDVLTGLANRTLFLERVAQYARSANRGGHKLALGLIDLDRFKSINNSLGRQAGDVLLKQVAEWLTQFMQDANQLARIDADHFVFLVPEVKSEGNLISLLETFAKTFQAHPFQVNNTELRLAARIGIALFPDDGTEADILFRNAEAALDKAKASGDQYLFYKLEMNEAAAGQLALENQLRSAIDNEEFVLYYQPKVNLVSGKVTSAEALIRWNDPVSGLVPPDKFIPMLEETGMILEIGRWALHKAIDDNKRWQAAGLATVRIAVNVSPLQMHNINFIDEIRQAIMRDSNAAAGLQLEITESVIMNDIGLNIATLQVIRAMGITIAIDDFGTGFSSLNYLSKLPVDTLKIDRSFVIEMDKPEGLALVTSIIVMAHALKLKVVAEGVETEEQSSQLRLLNCDEAQGYLFSKPVPAEVFEAKFLAPLAADDKQ